MEIANASSTLCRPFSCAGVHRLRRLPFAALKKHCGDPPTAPATLPPTLDGRVLPRTVRCKLSSAVASGRC